MDTSQGELVVSSPGGAGSGKASPTWPELLGSGHWGGLVDPLDLSLRRLVLLCGDLCQVTYDSFNSDSHSKYCGSCRYSKASLLQRTLFPAAADVSVAAYLYGASEASLGVGDFMVISLSREAWSKESNWVGYVAVSSDAAAAATGQRVIYIAMRGTIRTLEWVDVLKPELVVPDAILPQDDDSRGEARVMKGWYVIYTTRDERSPFSKYSARDQVIAAVKQLVAKYKDERLSIVCTGHSLGASLATLCAFDIVVNGVSMVSGGHVPVAAIVFGSPQIGNPAFKKRFDELPNLRVLHVRNDPDVIPLYPSGLLGYTNVGEVLLVDSKKSPFLKPNTTNIGDYHNLQAILHTVAGWNGKNGEFKLQVRRSVALVNKSCAYLKDDNLVPESWWVERNKGMVLGADGVWQLEPPAEGDLPVPPAVTGKVIDDDAAAAAASKETKPAADGKKKRSRGTGTKLLPSCFKRG